MLKKIKFFLQNIDIISFIYWNYISKSIVRERGVYVFPYKNAILDIDKTAQIYVYGKNIHIGVNKLKKSRAETYLKMCEGALWESKNGCGLFFGTTLEIKKNAKFESGYFTMNSGSCVICALHIVFGDDAMLGRNIIVYDSDHHKMLDKFGKMTNHSKKVTIGNHVWLTNQVMVLKGVTIADGTVVSPYTVIRKDVEDKSLVVNGMSNREINHDVEWTRDFVDDICV